MVDDIDPELCTHFVYGFAILDATHYIMRAYDPETDTGYKNYYAKFVGFRASYPDKKFILAIGGWTDSRTNKYSEMLADPAKRANFVTEAVKFIQKYNFDGLDLDYEYPAYQQPASEKYTFTAWVKELHDAFQPHGLELTAAVAAGQSTIEAGYEVAEISKYLDAIHLMTYDLHGSWENQVDHHAPLYARTNGDLLTVDHA